MDSGLPNDVAQLCFAKVPMDAVARARVVSRTFVPALSPTGRLPLAAFCICEDRTWLFLCRGRSGRSFAVPFSCCFPGLPDLDAAKLQVIGTGTSLMLVRSSIQFRDPDRACVLGATDCPGTFEYGFHEKDPGSLQGFDVWRMKWLTPEEIHWDPMPKDRWDFATAHLGKCVYFAGGIGKDSSAASSAVRLNLDTWKWEPLPPMREERSFRPSAFAIGGRLVVVGGRPLPDDGQPQSGEFYDPTTEAWTLVPGMWPFKFRWVFGGPQTVAVVRDVAYAINYDSQDIVQLKMDSPSFENVEWQVVGQLPLPQHPNEDWWAHSCLLSVQDELWAVYNGPNDDVVGFSCTPHLHNGGLQWEHLLYNLAPSALPLRLWTAGTDASN